MNKRLIVLALLVMQICVKAQQNNVTISVHPGVELLTIIQRLADQFPPSTVSAYQKEVDKEFGSFREHPAVKDIRGFKGDVYPDLTELGFCFSKFPQFELNLPDSINWYKLYSKEAVVNYLKDCRDFANASHFWEFYQKHLPQYESWKAPIAAGIAKDSLVEKLNRFYKISANPPSFYICLDPLNGWGAHAIPSPEKFNPDYSRIKAYTIGYFNDQASDSSTPVFKYGSYATNLVWHEGSHIYLAPLFARYKKQIEELAYLYNKDDPGMRSQNISNWEYCLNENIVRGIVISLFQKYKTERQWKKQNAQEIVNDFIYAEDIANFIRQDYLNGSQYKNFETYFPVLLGKLAKKYPRQKP